MTKTLVKSAKKKAGNNSMFPPEDFAQATFATVSNPQALALPTPVLLPIPPLPSLFEFPLPY
jgi:hypothetical protein